LILVGALVRMTGSGMGCPDWPKCFGQWVPPTEVSELPADYKTRFAVAGREIADFDAFKTWVEYVNRLIGVLIGLFSVATVVAAWPLRKRIAPSFWLSLGGLVGVLVVAGVGAYVVRTHLAGGMVTLHMMLALTVLALFVSALLASYRDAWPRLSQMVQIEPSMIYWGGAAVGLVLVQIVLGTQVREAVDEIAKASGEAGRESWLDQLGTVYQIHQVSYYSVVIAVIGWGRSLRAIFNHLRLVRGLYLSVLLVLVGEILLGLGMHHLGIPAWMQPSHLLLATLLFGSTFALAASLWLIRRASSSTPSQPMASQPASHRTFTT
jgi:heme a synthase